jgi:hypothetical protein
MSREDFFEQLFNEATPAADELKRLRQLAYEERVIKRVITDCGVNISSWGRLANLCRTATDEKKLNFNWFNEEYGNCFPGKLFGKRIPHVHSIKLPELFKPVKQNKLLRKLAAALAIAEIDPVKDAYLFVFPLIKTPYCLHTFRDPGYENPDAEDARFQLLVRIGAEKRPLFIEPLKTACKAIGSDWFPV